MTDAAKDDYQQVLDHLKLLNWKMPRLKKMSIQMNCIQLCEWTRHESDWTFNKQQNIWMESNMR